MIERRGPVALLLVTVLATWAPCAYQLDYARFRDAVYNCDSLASIRSLYEQTLRSINADITDPGVRCYWLGRTEHLMGRAEWEHADWVLSDSHFNRGLTSINTALSLGRSSDILRVKSALIGNRCLVKFRLHDYWFILTNGPSVVHLAAQALAADSSNGKALIQVGAAKVYPPPIYGGDPRVGIKMMERARAAPNIERDDLFNILSGIGICYHKLGRPDMAATYLREALTLYPNNRYVQAKYRAFREDY